MKRKHGFLIFGGSVPLIAHLGSPMDLWVRCASYNVWCSSIHDPWSFFFICTAACDNLMSLKCISWCWDHETAAIFGVFSNLSKHFCCFSFYSNWESSLRSSKVGLPFWWSIIFKVYWQQFTLMISMTTLRVLLTWGGVEPVLHGVTLFPLPDFCC